MKDIVKDCIREIMHRMEKDCFRGMESFYLRYEFFDMLEYLTREKIDYNTKKMYRLLDKLDEKVCKEYKCVSFCRNNE